MFNEIEKTNEVDVNKEQCHKKGKSHGILMLLCCLLPIAAVLFVRYSGTSDGWLGQAVPYLIVLLCPLSHVLMMVFMGKEKGKCH